MNWLKLNSSTIRTNRLLAVLAAVALLFTMLSAAPATVEAQGSVSLLFDLISYDYLAKTTTITYTLQGDFDPQDGYLVIGMCDGLDNSQLLMSSPTSAGIGTDPGTGIYGIKWDDLAGDGPWTVSFTVDGLRNIMPVNWAAKEGDAVTSDLNMGLACTTKTPLPGSLTINKYVEDTQELLPGATFEITGPNSTVVITDGGEADPDGEANGVIPLTGLAPGHYVVRETQAPEGYKVVGASGHGVTLEDGDMQKTVSFTNELWTGQLTVLKYDATCGNDPECLLDEATFKVERKEGDSWVEVYGEIRLEGGGFSLVEEPLGMYRITELTPPLGYDLSQPNPQIKTLELVAGYVQPLTFEFYNEPLEELNLTSMCSDNPDEARRWRIENPNDVDVDFTWDVYGTGHSGIGKATPGYSFFTTPAVEGANTTRIFVGEKLQDTSASSGEWCTTSIEIRKFAGPGRSEEDLLPGAEFTITGGPDGFEPITIPSSNNGSIIVNELPVGDYVVEETGVPSGYEGAPSQNFDVATQFVEPRFVEAIANPDVLIFENTEQEEPPPPPQEDEDEPEPDPEYGSIRIVKENEDGEPLEGAEFELRTEAGNRWGTSTYTTDDNGEVVISDLPDRTYVVVEITPPDGYDLADPAEQTVEVNDNETVEVTFVNPEEVEEEPPSPEQEPEPEPEQPVESEPEEPEASPLPETGGNYLLVIALGIALLTGGLVLMRSRA